jgi:hypothetical protein
MKRAVICLGMLLLLRVCVFADSNVRIEDVGLHGYLGTPAPILVSIHNPSPPAQAVHLQISIASAEGTINTLTSDLTLAGGEQRRLELPALISGGKIRISADVTAGGSSLGHDSIDVALHSGSLIALMCAKEEVCKTAQSQIEFSGDIQSRAQKNQALRYEVVSDLRDDWWAYSAANAIVLAMPTAQLTPAQRMALEAYLRCGKRLVIVEDEIADPTFLSAYRTTPPMPTGTRVGKGVLIRVSGLSGNQLGNIFIGPTVAEMINQVFPAFGENQSGWLFQRYATTFDFPRLRWLLFWLAAYIVVIGIVNFVVLRRLHLLEFGWISVCVIALLFAAGFYFSSVSKHPRGYRLDNLTTYHLDSRSPLAAADYQLRIATPERRDVLLSVADPAVFINANFAGDQEPNSQIWSEVNGQVSRATQPWDITVGPPRQVELPLLRWSFRDLSMVGVREFPGTVHFVAPDRLRNDTGQKFDDAVFVDYGTDNVYSMPSLAPGEEIQLDVLTPQRRHPTVWTGDNRETARRSLSENAVNGWFPFIGQGRMFAGLTQGAGLPVQLNVTRREDVHSLLIVDMEQP